MDVATTVSVALRMLKSISVPCVGDPGNITTANPIVETENVATISVTVRLPTIKFDIETFVGVSSTADVL